MHRIHNRHIRDSRIDKSVIYKVRGFSKIFVVILASCYGKQAGGVQRNGEMDSKVLFCFRVVQDESDNFPRNYS